MLSAGSDRALQAGVALGLAVANKEWAPAGGRTGRAGEPPARRRVPCLTIAIAVAVAVLAPLALVGSGGFVSATRATATAPSAIFQPWQVWWFFGEHGALVHGAFGVPEARLSHRARLDGRNPGHPLVVLAGVAVSWGLWLRQRRIGTPASVRSALLALALAMLLRCVQDNATRRGARYRRFPQASRAKTNGSR